MENNNNLPKSAGGGGEEEGKNIETEQVSNPNGQPQEGGEEQEPNLLQQPPPPPSSRRTPFTNLSQVDSDLALARTLQEQERAYMMLRMNNDGSDYGSWDAGSFLHYDDDFDDFGDPDHLDFDDDDVTDHGDDHDNHELDHSSSSSSAAAADQVDPFDVHAHSVDDDEEDDDDDADDVDEDEDTELDHSVYSSDEAYARALQEAEEREMAARLLALTGINDRQAVQIEDHAGNSQDTWEEVDPDELSYEELLALGDIVGTESRGLSADTIASLPSVKYMTGSNQNGSNDSCVICRLDYEDGETLTVLSCKHSYHSECINNWLKINKVCPFCSTEVSTSGHS